MTGRQWTGWCVCLRSGSVCAYADVAGATKGAIEACAGCFFGKNRRPGSFFARFGTKTHASRAFSRDIFLVRQRFSRSRNSASLRRRELRGRTSKKWPEAGIFPSFDCCDASMPATRAPLRRKRAGEGDASRLRRVWRDGRIRHAGPRAAFCFGRAKQWHLSGLLWHNSEVIRNLRRCMGHRRARRL